MGLFDTKDAEYEPSDCKVKFNRVKDYDKGKTHPLDEIKKIGINMA